LAAISGSPSQTGRYDVTGTTLTLDIEEDRTSYEYCVMGDAMVLTLPTATRVGQVLGSIVLQKQD
jgi:hypothetical protein